jgi:hypothetical protein
MTARNGKAERHGSVESGSGTITVGDGIFEGANSCESRFGEAAGTNPRLVRRVGQVTANDADLSGPLAA